MKVVEKISVDDLKKMAGKMYGSFVKADVDVRKKIVLLDMELHADGESELLAKGSKQNDLWGVNLHPDKYGTKDFIEFDSMINIRPSQKNMSRDIHDNTIKKQIKELISKVVHE